jgi:hypothetical protein
MPRDGSDIYHRPFPDVVPDTSIESTVYNGFVADVELEMNTPRPIIAGGTGTDNIDDVLNSIGGEKASQLVTNFDSHVWVPGSFRSLSSATGGPVAGHAFSGIVYSYDAPQSPPLNQNVVLQARDLNDTVRPGRTYFREKKAGVWDVWMGEARTVTAPTPPPNMPSGALWWDNDNGVLYINYDDGNSVQWVQVTALNAIDTSAYLRKTGDTMTGPLLMGPAATLTLKGNAAALLEAVPKQQMDTAIAAAVSGAAVASEALSYSGMQINGGFEVVQWGYGTVTANNAFAADGWKQMWNGPVVLHSTASNVPVPIVPGINGQLLVQPNTAMPTLAPANYAGIQQVIEGVRINRLGWGYANARPLTLVFWSSHSRTGLYSGSLRNGTTNDRSYVFTYTQAAANVAQYNTIQIPPPPATGGWENGNLAGITLVFTLACGTTYTAPAADAWQTGNYLAAPGQINSVDVAGASFRITGVAVLAGPIAPLAANSPLLMRPLGQEQEICRRYWQTVGMAVDVVATTATPAALGVTFAPVMRAIPVMTAINNGVISNVTSVGFPSIDATHATVQIAPTALTRFYWYGKATADARL